MKHTIKLLGTGCLKSRAVEENIRVVLGILDTDISYKYISNIDELMNYDTGTTPSVVIGDEVIFRGVVPSVEELIKAIRLHCPPNIYPSEYKNGKLKILIPVDYSTLAANAVHFTLNILKNISINIEIHLIHFIHSIELDASEKSMDLKEYMASKLGFDAADARIICKEESSFVVDGLVEKTKNDAFDLVIMSTNGNEGFWNKLLGTLSADFITKSYCPVLVLPPRNDVYKSDVQTLMYAIEDNALDVKHLSKVVRLCYLLGTKLIFLNASDSFEKSKAIIEKLINYFSGEYNSNIEYHVHAVVGKTFEASVKEMADAKQFDWLIIKNKRRGTLESILTKSYSKEFVQKAEFPVLVFHDDDQKSF